MKHKKRQTKCGTIPENMNQIDRTIRLVTGILLLSPFFITGHISLPIGFIPLSSLVSIYPLFTALCKWDPIYEILRISTLKDSVSNAVEIENLANIIHQDSIAESNGDKINKAA